LSAAVHALHCPKCQIVGRLDTVEGTPYVHNGRLLQLPYNTCSSTLKADLAFCANNPDSCISCILTRWSHHRFAVSLIYAMETWLSVSSEHLPYTETTIGGRRNSPRPASSHLPLTSRKQIAGQSEVQRGIPQPAAPRGRYRAPAHQVAAWIAALPERSFCIVVGERPRDV